MKNKTYRPHLLMRSLREDSGKSQSQLAKLVGWENQSRWSNYETGARAVTRSAAKDLSEHFDIPAWHFLENTDVRYDQLPNVHTPHINIVAESNAKFIGMIGAWDSDTPLNEDETEVPYLIDVELAAGMGNEVINEQSDFKLRFSLATLKRCNVEPTNAVCVKVSGSSMQPRLYDGDVVGVDVGSKRIQDGKVYAINHSGLLRIKILERLPRGGILIKSYNKLEHPDETIDAEERDEINIIGRVFWSSSIW